MWPAQHVHTMQLSSSSAPSKYYTLSIFYVRCYIIIVILVISGVNSWTKVTFFVVAPFFV